MKNQSSKISGNSPFYTNSAVQLIRGRMLSGIMFVYRPPADMLYRGGHQCSYISYSYISYSYISYSYIRDMSCYSQSRNLQYSTYTHYRQVLAASETLFKIIHGRAGMYVCTYVVTGINAYYHFRE